MFLKKESSWLPSLPGWSGLELVDSILFDDIPFPILVILQKLIIKFVEQLTNQSNWVGTRWVVCIVELSG